ncbi:hypothetical protein AA0Y32_06020 [Georgenia phoenicis]|uniref:hypothetical protein n=1 Tax=unclassified Georgenia TaxID=2626815 RepID=UPI0039B08674
MLSVENSPQLQAAVLAMKAADKDLRRDINQATRETMNPVWKSLVDAHMAGTSVMANRVLNKGVRIAAGNPPRAVAATSTRGVGDGKRVTPARDYAGWEFGASRNAYSRYERKNRARSGYHVVERRTMRHLPPRTPKGRHIYPAFADIGPRMVSLWVQLIVRKYHDAAEGK